MDDGPEWFAPKRYGLGSGPPISWQGWAVSLAFVAYATAVTVWLRAEPFKMVAAILPALVAFCTICARTTRGGWRWRWGEDD
jgi:hypothetical protein